MSGKVAHRHDAWIFESGLCREDKLCNHVDCLLKRLAPYAQRVKAASNVLDIMFSCVIYSDSIPEIFFEKSQVAKIALLGADLDVDIYIVSSDHL